MEINTKSICVFRYGCVVDGVAGAAKATYGFHVLSGGLMEITNSASLGYVFFRSCDTGILADTGGIVTGITNTQFSGCTSNYTADAATFALIN